MSDITTFWKTSYGDYAIAGADLASGDDLETAFLISLFTDRVALSDDIITDGSTDPRGWWGDSGEEFPIGSRIWLLQRANMTTETLANARDYIREALQWLITDGVVAKFDVYCEWTRPKMLGALVTAYKPDGSIINLQFQWVWNEIS